jgi:sarcosine oxidase subunit gamma
LGGATPRVDTIGTLTISENTSVALASVAARAGQEKACEKILAKILEAPAPGPGKSQQHDPEAGFWMGPNQWMLGAPFETHEDLADQLKAKLKDTASVTEQSDAWVVFDVQGAAMEDACELLCNLPIRTMVAGDATRTMIHQMGCFVIRRNAHDHIRILGPRSSAGSLHHALVTAARSIA